MSRRLLTLDDLYNYYEKRGKTTHFNAKNDNDIIVVQVPGNAFFKKQDNYTEGLKPVQLQACHILENANHSFISEKTMEDALPSFSNRPILGYIYQDDNGEYQFRDHAMHIDDDGELVYDEICVGIIPESCDAHLDYDEEKDKTYVVVNGYIFEDYTKASEIIDREGECSVSVELDVKELSYDAKNKRLNIEDFTFSGVTILGRWEDGSSVEPGMNGANIKISDFKKNNSLFSEDIVTKLEELESKFEELKNTVETEKGGNQMADFDENVEVTETDEVTTEESAGEAEATHTEDETVGEFEVEEKSEDEFKTEEEPEQNFVKMSIDVNGVKKEFSVSLMDKLNALFTLVNDTYGESDNAFYSVDAIEEDKLVYMHDYWNDKHYRQKYAVKKDVYSLVGDRIPVFVSYLSEDEQKQLESMKSNYSSISEKLQKYEDEPQKLEVIQSEEYAAIVDSDEYKEFSKRESYFDKTVDEVKQTMDEMLLNAAKAGKIEFAKSEQKSVGMKKLPTFTNKKSGRYGGLFSKK